MSADSTQGFFHRYAGDFDAIYSNRNGPLNALVNRFFRRSMLLRYLKTVEGCQPVAGLSVLDVGCGPGHYAITLAQRGAASVLGIDFAEGMLELAAHHATRAGVGDRCVFRAGDFSTFTSPERFDYVIVMGFMDYMADPQAVVDRVISLTRRKAFFSFPAAGGFLAWQRQLRYRARCPLYLYTEPQIRALLTRHPGMGAKIERIDRDFFLTLSASDRPPLG